MNCYAYEEEVEENNEVDDDDDDSSYLSAGSLENEDDDNDDDDDDDEDEEERQKLYEVRSSSSSSSSSSYNVFYSSILKNKEFIFPFLPEIPSAEECGIFLYTNIPGTNHTYLKILGSFLGPLIEMVLKNTDLKFFYEIRGNDPDNSKVFEILLKINWKQVAVETLQMILKENFNMKEVQIQKAIELFGTWLESPKERLPFSSLLKHQHQVIGKTLLKIIRDGK
jgi:hypothetical protein